MIIRVIVICMISLREIQANGNQLQWLIVVDPAGRSGRLDFIAVCQGNSLAMDKVTDTVSSSPSPERVLQISPSRCCVALPPCPGHHSSSILPVIDGYFEGSLTENGTERELTEGDRCMYILCIIACADC
jgi:hypothetical protein